MSKKIESPAASSVVSLLTKIRNLASRPIPEFNKFEALELLEALKNAAQDVKHEKTGYFWLTFETPQTKMNQSNEQFRNFLLPLLGDKGHEKILLDCGEGRESESSYPGKAGKGNGYCPILGFSLPLLRPSWSYQGQSF